MEKKIWQKPVFFQRNRVFRVYLGGELYREFLGDADGDGFYPEEWIASSVRAINPGHTDPLEGISLTQEDSIPFDRLLREHRKEMLGSRQDLAVLVKFLDSAIRLPMQVHPTREFSRQHFGSPYGKAEAWLILATRPGACIYFGFREQTSPEEFARAVEANRTDPESQTGLVNRIEVAPGDVFFVPAGVIHAIGPGCMLLEAQEPTDFTIQPEYHCGDYALNAQEMYLGLDEKTALSCFDHSLYGQKVLDMGKKTPRLLSQTPGLEIHELIGPQDTPCFTMTRYTCKDGSAPLTQRAAVYIVTGGTGELVGEHYSRALKTGDYFFLPYEAKDYAVRGNVCFVCCAGGE